MNATALRFLFAGLGLVSALTACSSSSDATPDPGSSSGSSGTSGSSGNPGDRKVPGADGGPAADGAASDALTCLSHTWCGSGSVTRWNGQTLPTARGGAIPDGLYREAYILAEKGSGTAFGDYGEAMQFRGGAVRTFGGLSKIGTFTSAGGKLSVAYASYCDDETGKVGDALTTKEEIDYLVDGQGQLFIFSKSTGSAGAQTVAHVYLLQATLCGNLPKAVPTAPGDSYVCKVTNCGCTESTNGPASAQVCKFVHGG